MAVINALKVDIHTCIHTDFCIRSKKTLAVTNSTKFQDEVHDRVHEARHLDPMK